MCQICDLDASYTGVDESTQDTQECMRLMCQICDLDSPYAELHRSRREYTGYTGVHETHVSDM